MLFASMTGVLAAWGMSIVKANAFSNAAGVVVDTFHFTDRFRTLELNLPEWDRFKRASRTCSPATPIWRSCCSSDCAAAKTPRAK